MQPRAVEAATRRRRAAEGIPIDDATWATFALLRRPSA